MKFLDFADRLYDFVNRLASWPIVAILVVGMLLFNQGFAGRREVTGAQNQLLDGRRWYTPADTAELFSELGELRFYYAFTELTLDLIYPLTYSLLFAILILRTWGARYTWLMYIPLLTLIFDLVENILITFMALTFDGSPTGLAWAAAVFTLGRTLLFLGSLLLVLNGGVIRLFDQR